MSELKLCPFCGGEGKVIKLNQKGFKGEYKVFIRCARCGIKTNTQYPFPHDSYLTRLERAINSWNNNISPIADHLQQENKKLHELVQLVLQDLKVAADDNGGCYGCAYLDENEKCTSVQGKIMCDCKTNNMWQWQHADKLKGLIEL